MENAELDENIKAKEVELAQLFGFSSFEHSPSSYMPTANLNFEKNVSRWLPDSFAQQFPVHNLRREMAQLQIDIPYHVNFPPTMIQLSAFDPSEFIQEDHPCLEVSSKDFFEPQIRKDSYKPQIRDPSKSYNSQFERERRFNQSDRYQYKKRHNRNNRRKFAVDEEELESLVIDLNELKLGSEFEQTTEEDLLNDFWRLYTYLDGIRRERQNIMKAFECSNSVWGETYVPIRALTIKQSCEYSANSISMELDMVQSILKAIRYFYSSELDPLIEKSEISLMEIKASMENFHAAAGNTIQDCSVNHRARDLNSKLDYLQNALSNATFHVRKLATSMFVLAHYVTEFVESNECATGRNTFHGS